MDWVCPNCERTYHEDPPEACRVCGHDALVPAADHDPGGLDGYLAGVRERLLDPLAADRSLVDDDRYVAAAFRLVVLLSVAVALVAAAVLLFG